MYTTQLVTCFRIQTNHAALHVEQLKVIEEILIYSAMSTIAAVYHRYCKQTHTHTHTHTHTRTHKHTRTHGYKTNTNQASHHSCMPCSCRIRRLKELKNGPDNQQTYESRPTLSFAFKSNPQDFTKYSTMDSWPSWVAQCKAV